MSSGNRQESNRDGPFPLIRLGAAGVASAHPTWELSRGWGRRRNRRPVCFTDQRLVESL